MHVTVEPPLAQWSLGVDRGDVRQGLADLALRSAERLGTAPLADTRRLIATGHQAALWHPGILAKDLAMCAAAARLGTGVCHLIVDQDVHETMSVDLPLSRDGWLSVEAVQLAPVSTSIPTGSQPPVDAAAAIEVLTEVRRRHGGDLVADVQPIIDALADLPSCGSLAEQIAAVTERLMRPWTGPTPVVFASDLLALPAAAKLVDQMLADARRCVEAYNSAVVEHPAAGITALAVEPGRIELPLWHLRFGRPRLRVYAKVGDEQVPRLVDETGRAIGGTDRLAPRALLLTAVMRGLLCDLFVHGKGGWVYDRVTELWWRKWRSEELAPMALASADLHLRFAAPAGDGADLARALWWAHHLPHNLDRHVADLTPAERALADDKRRIIAGMRADGDRSRRARYFARLHEINDTLARGHGEAIDAAQRGVGEARRGVANRAIARRRDWCFGLYAAQALGELVGAIRQA